MRTYKSKLRRFIRLWLEKSGLRPPVQESQKDRWLKRNNAQLAETERLTCQDIADLLLRSGLKEGDTLWLQSSWDTLSPHKINPVLLISTLQELVGPEGNIAMPAFLGPKDMQKPVVDFRRAASETGMLTEIFRRTKGVRRSTQLHGSICVWGKDADHITQEHQNSENAFGKGSAFDVLLQKNALCVSLGFGDHPTFLTPVHLVEGLEHHSIPAFNSTFGDAIKYNWINDLGKEGTSSTQVRKGHVNVGILREFFTAEHYFKDTFETGNIVSIRCQDLYAETKRLARKQITIYSKSILICRLLNILR